VWWLDSVGGVRADIGQQLKMPEIAHGVRQFAI
jgi:hypothetical protein